MRLRWGVWLPLEFSDYSHAYTQQFLRTVKIFTPSAYYVLEDQKINKIIFALPQLVTCHLQWRRDTHLTPSIRKIF